jgi:hypothetical protein
MWKRVSIDKRTRKVRDRRQLKKRNKAKQRDKHEEMGLSWTQKKSKKIFEKRSFYRGQIWPM